MSFLLWLVFAEILAGNPCREAIERQLESWSTTDEILKAPGGPLGGSVFRIATSEVGVWVTLHRPAAAEITSVARTDSEGSLQRAFHDRTCEGETRRVSRPPGSPPRGFSDDELKALLSRDARLVVFLWSPHLPLSVDGYAEIESATASLGIPFVATVDPAADPDYVRRAAIEQGIPVAATRPLRSVELLFRDLAVHTPSAIVFWGGGVSAPLPGYRNRTAYRAWLQVVFGERKHGDLPGAR